MPVFSECSYQNVQLYLKPVKRGKFLWKVGIVLSVAFRMCLKWCIADKHRSSAHSQAVPLIFEVDIIGFPGYGFTVKQNIFDFTPLFGIRVTMLPPDSMLSPDFRHSEWLTTDQSQVKNSEHQYPFALAPCYPTIIKH